MKTLEGRFWAKVDRRGDDECWPWTASCSHGGYGRFNDGGRMAAAHRVSWRLAHGSDAGELVVCHSCDNPPCVNPAHLWLGTTSDNVHDMTRKSRNRNRVLPDGSRTRVLPPEVVRAAVADYVAGRGTQAELAAKYGTSRSSISLWVRGQARWLDAGTSPQQRPQPTCGTEAAYSRHLRRGESACRPCRAAHAERVRSRAQRKAAS